MSTNLSPVSVGTPGRKPVISREDIIDAALRLVGPHRSLSTLSLREVAREAGIAPNSFYRQFRDMDELAVALIERAGESLRRIIGEARQRASVERSVVRGSIEAFMEQLRADDRLLHILLREGMVGSPGFKQAVERQLGFFEDELRADLIRLAEANKTSLFEPLITARAITRLVFAMGARLMDLPPERHDEFTEEVVLMVRMIVTGTQTLGLTGASVR
jgi:TetR/AcrR family transcriptional regulator, fatty acid biosynthesis regulator